MKKLNSDSLRDFLQCWQQEDGDLVWRKHAEERKVERSITTGDIKYLLTHQRCTVSYAGKATRNNHKYKICGTTPNSGHRTIFAIIIVGKINGIKGVKIITVMWEDLRTRHGY